MKDKRLQPCFGCLASRIIQRQPAHFIEDSLGLLCLFRRCGNPQLVSASPDEVDGIAVNQVPVLANVESCRGAGGQAFFQRHCAAGSGYDANAVSFALLRTLLEPIAGIRAWAFGWLCRGALRYRDQPWVCLGLGWNSAAFCGLDRIRDWRRDWCSTGCWLLSLRRALDGLIGLRGTLDLLVQWLVDGLGRVNLSRYTACCGLHCRRCINWRWNCVSLGGLGANDIAALDLDDVAAINAP